eukprot:bmy_04781T0
MRAQLLKKYSLESIRWRGMSSGPCLVPAGSSAGAATCIPGSYMRMPSNGTPVYSPLRGKGPDHMVPEGQYHNIIKVYTPVEFKRELQAAVLRTHCS